MNIRSGALRISEKNRLLLDKSQSNNQPIRIESKDFVSFFKYSKRDPSYDWKLKSEFQIWANLQNINLDTRKHSGIDRHIPLYIYFLFILVIAVGIFLIILLCGLVNVSL